MDTSREEAILELRDVSYRYPGSGKPVFSGLNFRLGHEKVGLVGDNGSGKTTLLHIMVGLIRPDQGEVIFNGRVMRDEKDFFFLRSRVGMIFQNADDQLFSPTVLEDVAFGPLNLGLSREEAVTISRQTLERVGLRGYENRVTHRLSGGEKRLVALATVLAMNPRILLLDEPTNDLDHHGRRRLCEILGSLDQAFLLISHDWDFLASLCSRYCGLEQGRFLESDTLEVHQHRHAHPLGGHGHHHSH